MKEKQKKVKLKKWDKIFFLVLGSFFIGMLVLSISGKLVLLNETMRAGFILTLSIYPFLLLIKVRTPIRNMIVIYVMLLVMFVFGLWISSNIVRDVIDGPKKVTLQLATLSVHYGSGKYRHTHYYLNGTLPDDKKFRMRLSNREYKYFRRNAGPLNSRKYYVGEVTITYYVHTNQLYDY